jgi:hypothetical protein
LLMPTFMIVLVRKSILGQENWDLMREQCIHTEGAFTFGQDLFHSPCSCHYYSSRIIRYC